MTHQRRWWGAAALSALLVCLAAPVAAQEPSQLERAKASFKAGANAYAAGDYLAAIQALEAAYELTPLPAIAFSLAQAERKQYGVKLERLHLQRAISLFRRYLEQEPDGARRADARQALAELEPRLGEGLASEPPAKTQARPTRLMIVSDTPGARITLDGGAASGSPLIREVKPGRHVAHASAPGYKDAERAVTAVPGELLLTELPLSERPASLYVWAPADADIFVDGVYVAQGGALVTLALPTGRHQLVVAQKGKQLVRRDVRLVRGQARTEVVTLEPTTQRQLSEYLFIAGGAALGGGVVLSALAVGAQNSAEDFLRDQQHREMSSAELVAYQASIIQRDRFRTAAGIGVAASLGFFITGLFLHELDRPSLASLPRHGEARRREGKLSPPRLAFSPLATSRELGASLRLSF